MSDLFGFPYEEINRAQPHAAIISTWEKARSEKCVPVLIVADEMLLETLDSNNWEDKPLPSLAEYCAPYIEELKEESDYDDELLGQPADLDLSDGMDTGNVDPLGMMSIRGDDSPLVLARFPVAHPWEILKYMPLGDWNECPPADVFAAFFKEMNERFGAVPLLVSGDTLTVRVERRPTREEAYDLALTLYALDGDLIDTYGSIPAFASWLMKSDYWFFWWD